MYSLEFTTFFESTSITGYTKKEHYRYPSDSIIGIKFTNIEYFQKINYERMAKIAIGGFSLSLVSIILTNPSVSKNYSDGTDKSQLYSTIFGVSGYLFSTSFIVFLLELSHASDMLIMKRH